MMAWLSVWWVWLAIAMILGIIEILAPGFVFLGIALGAAIMSALLLFAPDALASMGINATFAVFAALSLVSWFGLRFAFRKQSSEAQIFTKDIND